MLGRVRGTWFKWVGVVSDLVSQISDLLDLGLSDLGQEPLFLSYFGPLK